MTPETFLSSFDAALDALITGAVSGKAFVRRIDALMADDLPDGLSDSLLGLLNTFQDNVALYVQDEDQRVEHQAYFGPDELRCKALAMKESLQAVRPGGADERG